MISNRLLSQSTVRSSKPAAKASAWSVAALLLALLPAAGCGGKPAPAPPGAETNTKLDVDMGPGSDAPGDPAQVPAASPADNKPADEQPDESESEKDK
jgi:hypothetical protein